MKKILIIANNAGGLYIFRKDLISALIQKGCKVTALIPFTSRIDELRSLGLNLIETHIDRRGKNPIHELDLIHRYFKHIRKVRPDLIITYTVKPNIYGGLISRTLKIPYAVNITGLGTAFQDEGMLKNIVTLLYKVSLKNANVVFFENSENMRTFLKLKIVKKQQVCLLNGAGVDLEHFSYIDYPKDDSETRFLFVGRVMREKGVDELFAAMKMLRKQGIKCSLDVLGGYEENYQNIIEKYEKEGWLHYHGFQEDVRPFIANCHCFVLPSWHEGMANTNLECAASGRPIITTNIHGCKEAVINHVTGLLCEPKNINSLYNAMVTFIRQNDNEKIEFGIRGRAYMKQRFDKRFVVKKTIERLNNPSNNIHYL